MRRQWSEGQHVRVQPAVDCDSDGAPHDHRETGCTGKVTMIKAGRHGVFVLFRGRYPGGPLGRFFAPEELVALP